MALVESPWIVLVKKVWVIPVSPGSLSYSPDNSFPDKRRQFRRSARLYVWQPRGRFGVRLVGSTEAREEKTKRRRNRPRYKDRNTGVINIMDSFRFDLSYSLSDLLCLLLQPRSASISSGGESDFNKGPLGNIVLGSNPLWRGPLSNAKLELNQCLR